MPEAPFYSYVGKWSERVLALISDRLSNPNAPWDLTHDYRFARLIDELVNRTRQFNGSLPDTLNGSEVRRLATEHRVAALKLRDATARRAWGECQDTMRLVSACRVAMRESGLLEALERRGASGEKSSGPETAGVDGPPAAIWNALTDRQRGCLIALRELRAFDADKRQRTDDIAKHAEGPAVDPAGFKEPLAELVNRGLLESKRGAGGGYWLTTDGAALLTAMRPEQSRRPESA